MATNYSPPIVTDGAFFVGDALMPSTATSINGATKLYNRAGSSSDGTMFTGGCCDFDGTDDDFFTTSDITLSGAFAISVWVKGDGSSFGGGWVISNKSGGPVNLAMRLVNPGSGLKIQYYYYSGAWRSIYSTATISANTWTHLVLSRTSGNYVSFYIDGELDSTTQAEDAGGVTGNTVNGPVNVVGGYWGSAVFSGSMADFKVFNTNLSSAQVKEMYDDSKVIIPAGIEFSNLDLWYSMAEGTGTIAYDGSGNKNSGVGQNFNDDEFLSGQNGCPQLIQGYNRPMLLDGSTDYVSIADSASLSVGSTFTISYWFYPESVTTEAYHVSKNTYSGNQKSYAVLQASSGKTQFRISGDGSSHIECTGSTTMSNKTWHHIVHVFDGSAGTKLKGWVDGTAQTFNQQPNVTGPYDSTSILCLGTRDAGLVAPLKGIINEVIIYNSALSDANATALFATGPNGGPLPPDPLSMSTSGNIVGYWRNDSNVTLTDLSGNSNTGTAVGSPSALLFKEGYNGNKNVNTGRDHQGFPLRCKNNGAVGFEDGGVTYIDKPISTDLQVSTLLVWVKFTELGRYFIKSAGGSPGYYQWYVHADGKLQMEFSRTETGVAATTVVGAAGDVAVDTWYQLGIILNSGTNTGTIYKNGNLLKQSAWSTNGALTPSTLYLGTTSFGGQMANFQIYNRALSRAEILQNYNAQKSRFT